jgi:shikimate dehydrogenase
MSGGSNESVDASTRLCAVLGQPVRHSASPAMQNAGIAALQLNWRYLAAEVPPGDLRAAIAGAKAMRFLGINLTVPHKLLAVEMVEALSESARLLGAVNTIVFETRGPGGGWIPLGQVPDEQITEVRSHGHNTDAEALVRSLKEEFPSLELRGASVVLLGAGGAARTAALRLAAEGVGRLFVINRTAEKAAELMAEIKARFPAVTPAFMPDSADLVINATSLGLKADDPPPIGLNRLKSSRAQRAYDMIYRPAETAFLRAAKNAGCQTANGLGMLLYQGAAALELWSGQPAPVEIMRAALQKNIYG